MLEVFGSTVFFINFIAIIFFAAMLNYIAEQIALSISNVIANLMFILGFFIYITLYFLYI